MKPTRTDIAFDFQVESDFLADHLRAAVFEHYTAAGLIDGIAGQGGINTWYIGGSSASRRIRIYRKDFQDPQVKEPILRVELILIENWLETWWPVYSRSYQDGFDLAVKWVSDMTGFLCREAGTPSVEVVQTENPDLVSTVAALIRQYGEPLEQLLSEGFPLCELLQKIRQSKVEGRMAKSRRVRRSNELAALGGAMGLLYELQSTYGTEFGFALDDLDCYGG